MRKSEMNSLVAGVKIQSKKDLAVYTIVGIDLEQGKVILDNGKLYTMGTIQRWYSLYEEEISEVVEPDNTILDDIEQADELTSEQDTTADTEQTAQDTEEQTNTNDLKDTDTQDDQLHEDTEQTTKTHTTEGNTATTTQDTEKQTNTSDLKDTDTQDDQLHEQQDTAVKNEVVEANTGTIRQNNLITDINNLMDLHDVQMEAKKEYIKVSIPGKRGALCMIRPTRFGTGIHIDFKSKILAKLDENYRGMLIEQYNCSIYDKTRGYYRVFDCSDLEVLRTIILTAKQVG